MVIRLHPDQSFRSLTITVVSTQFNRQRLSLSFGMLHANNGLARSAVPIQIGMGKDMTANWAEYNTSYGKMMAHINGNRFVALRFCSIYLAVHRHLNPVTSRRKQCKSFRM